MKPSDRFESISSVPRMLPRLRVVALLTALIGIQSAAAELPALMERDWLGQFAVFKNRDYQFTISSHGEIRIAPYPKDGNTTVGYIVIPIHIGIVGISPDGTNQWFSIQPETLESTDPATNKLKKAVFRGKVTGGAAFEATVEEARGIIFISGRVTAPGTATKNPLRFQVLTKIPYFYGHVEKDTREKKQAFEAKIKSDNVVMKFINGKRHKEWFITPVDAGSPEINAPGIASAEFDIKPLRGRKFLLSASENTPMSFANANRAPNESGTPERPLYEGLHIFWTADPAKDPQGSARVSFQMK
jgi:hypothetical protein